MVAIVLISYLDDNHGFFFMILHMFVIVKKGTFKSHVVVLLDIFKPYVFTFEHRRLFETRTSPVLYCKPSVELSTAALCR